MIKDRTDFSPTETNEHLKFVVYTPGMVYAAVSGRYANAYYTFVDGEEITEETVKKKIRNNNVMDWMKVKSKANSDDVLSLVLPTFIKDINGKVKVNSPGRDHLIGDVAVASISPKGTPMLNEMSIIDGQDLPKLYDLHAYQGKYTEEQMNNDVEKPDSLISDLVLHENIQSAEHAVDFKNLVNTIADIMYEFEGDGTVRDHVKVKWSCNAQKSDIVNIKYQKTAAGNLKALIRKLNISTHFPYSDVYDIYKMSVIFNQKTKKVMLMYTGKDEQESKLKTQRMVIDSKYYIHPKFRDALKKVVSQIDHQVYKDSKKVAGDFRHEAMMLNKMFRIMSKPLDGLQSKTKEYKDGHLVAPTKEVRFESNMGELEIKYQDGA